MIERTLFYSPILSPPDSNSSSPQPAGYKKSRASLPTNQPDFDPTLGVQQQAAGKLDRLMVLGQQVRDNASAKKQKTDDTNVDFRARAPKENLSELFAPEDEGSDGGGVGEDGARPSKAERKKQNELDQQKGQQKKLAKHKISDAAKQHLALEEGATRKATKKIVENKGLVRLRPKKFRNSRVKHKLKYEKAVKNRKTVVQTMREGDLVYGGEMSGIRSTVVKSHKLG